MYFPRGNCVSESPDCCLGGVLFRHAHNLFGNSFRNVSILTVAMRSEPAKINLLAAYWLHDIPVCDFVFIKISNNCFSALYKSRCYYFNRTGYRFSLAIH